MPDAEEAEHRIAHRADDVLVGAPQRHDELHVLREPGGDELLDEVDPHAPGQEDVERLGLQGADLREFGSVIELAELCVHLVDELALEVALEPSRGIVAANVVGGKKKHVLQVLARDVLPRSLAVRLARP